MENKDKKRILEMIKEGKLSVEEGMDLLNAIGEDGVTSSYEAAVVKPAKNKKRKIRIAVFTEDGDEKADVNISVPINLVKALLPVLNSGIIPENAREEMDKHGVDMDAVMTAIDAVMENLDDLDEDVVNIDAGGDGSTKVRIYVD